MLSFELRGVVRLSQVAGLALVALGGAHAEDAGTWKYSGFFDIYYGRDTRKIGANNTISYRQYDVRNTKLTAANALLSVERTAGKGLPVGIVLQFSAGDATQLLHAADPNGGRRTQTLWQGYLTYNSGGNSPLTVDFGKFMSWIGYEGHTSADNDNYSRGILFYTAQPAYHTGFRATKAVGGATVGLYGVLGWNEVADSNQDKSYGASVSLNPIKNASLSLNYYGGREGRVMPGIRNSNSFGGIAQGPGQWTVNLVDGILVYNASSKLKFAVNADYASAKGQTVGGVATPGGTWYGFAGYAKYIINEKFSLAGRAETVHDTHGLRTGTDQTLGSLTATLSYNVNPLALARVEFRSDKSTSPVFLGEAGSAKSSRSTWSVSYVLKF